MVSIGIHSCLGITQGSLNREPRLAADHEIDALDMKHCHQPFLAAGAALLLSLVAPILAAEDKADSGKATHAILLNGGHNPSSNYLSHLNHIEELTRHLQSLGLPDSSLHVLSADGSDPGKDLARRDPKPERYRLIEGTRLGRRLRPQTELIDTPWSGPKLEAATNASLERTLHEIAQAPAPPERVLLFVTDHGTLNQDDPANNNISMWHEDLSVRQLGGMLASLPDATSTTMVMSQCYSGSFAELIFDRESAEPSGKVCGFFSTTRDRRAYGCYPEGRDRDRIGHAFRFIEALGDVATTSQAHRRVLESDATPDVPLRSSDLYLHRVLEAEADHQGAEFDSLVDSLLALAWQNPAEWEPEIRLLDRLGDRFGTFSPRSLAEMKGYSSDLEALLEETATYARRWNETLVDLKESVLRSALQADDGLRQQLSSNRAKDLSAAERAGGLERVLDRAQHYLYQNPELEQRLKRLEDKALAGDRAKYRLEVRTAVVKRLRNVLISVAGDQLLSDRPDLVAKRHALDRLEQCENLEIGHGQSFVPPLVTDAFPRLEDDVALTKDLQPSWLGVRFRPLAADVRTDRGLPEGATLLDVVFPDSPAARAGLEPGDVMLGPPGDLFATQRQLKEWTMVSPQGRDLEIEVLRLAGNPDRDQRFVTDLRLEPYPRVWPELAGPPTVGEQAPELPKTLELVRGRELNPGEPAVIFFWATWCGPCKAAVPELVSFARGRDLPVLAISDEDPATVEDFLGGYGSPFFSNVAVDPLRRSFVSYQVSGTPTILVRNGAGQITLRQVGYNKKTGLLVDGWSYQP